MVVASLEQIELMEIEIDRLKEVIAEKDILLAEWVTLSLETEELMTELMERV